MALYTAQIEKLYVTFFNRPADFNGLIYWEDQVAKAGGNSAAVANAFSASAEYKALYDGKSTSTIIDTIYQNLFGRAAEPDGLAYWGLRLDNGTFNIGTIANSIAIGAQNADITTINNKVAAATAFTAALDTNAEILGYEQTSVAGAQAIKDWLKAVTSDAATLTAAQTALPALVIATVAGASTNPGQTFTLTASADTFTGAAGNDTFNANVVADGNGVATVETLTSLDVLAGGEGADVLNYTTVGGAALPAATISGIETINVASDGAVTANVSGANITGVTTLTAKAAAGAVDIDTKANVTSVTVTGTATTVAIDDAGTAVTSADKITAVSVTGNTGALTIGAGFAVDSLTSLSLAKTNQDATVTATAGTRALTVNLNEVTGGIIQDNTATTLTVNASGVKSSGVTLNAAAATAVTIAADETLGVTDVNIAAAKTLTVTGDSLVTIAATSTVTALESVVSTGSTGGVAITAALGTGVTVTGGAGKDSVSLAASHAKAVAMGAGDDTVTMAGAVTTGGSVDAGEGTDTLSMTAAVAESVSAGTTFEAGISNFEKVKLGAALGGQTDTIDMANLDDINYVITAGGAAAVAAVAQVSDVNLTGLTTDAGDTVSLVVGGATFTTAAGAYANGNAIEVALATVIDADPAYAAAIVGGALRITASVPGTAFVVGAATVTNAGGGTADANPTVATTPVTANVAAATGGALVINNLASAGTIELTGAITAASTVAVKDAASGTSDILNIKLNGANQIVNAAALTVANVETINIEATDSAADTTTLDNPSAASTVLLNAAAATKIVVTGNHGVDFTGSTLTKVVELDASGVVSVGDAAGATAATIAAVGAVTFSSVVADKAVTVTTGNGADVISVASINDATFLATNVTASTISTGAGDDQITGSAGKDVINGGEGKDTITAGAEADTLTGGAGNDTFVFAAATDSVLAKMDIITDFSANTYGNGTSGAAGTGAAADATKWTGDVLTLNVDLGTYTKVDVNVVTNAADATVFIQNVANATSDTIAAALDSVTGKLYIDMTGDGTVDSVIGLTGVTTITEAAFVLV